MLNERYGDIDYQTMFWALEHSDEPREGHAGFHGEAAAELGAAGATFLMPVRPRLSRAQGRYPTGGPELRLRPISLRTDQWQHGQARYRPRLRRIEGVQHVLGGDRVGTEFEVVGEVQRALVLHDDIG